MLLPPFEKGCFVKRCGQKPNDKEETTLSEVCFPESAKFRMIEVTSAFLGAKLNIHPSNNWVLIQSVSEKIHL